MPTSGAGAAQALILAALLLGPTRAPTAAQQTASTATTLDLPCCFASAQNATSLGPVVVLRRDDEQPSGLGAAAAVGDVGADPTWEATLRRAATRALTWEGLTDAPFVASPHSAEVLAGLDEPSDIRVLARGLLVANRDGRPVFREVDLPGERCVDCPAELTGPNGETIKAMWSVRRIRHSGPNADHRPCYELQFSVSPIVPALPPLSRWEPPAASGSASGSRGLRAGLRAESRVSRQRELRPKGLILRVNPAPDTLPTPPPSATTSALTPRTDAARTTLAASTSPAVSVLATTPAGRVHEHLHHHFYVRGGVPVYAGSTTETQFPTTPTVAAQPFRASPQYHEYSQPDPLFHPPPGFGGHVAVSQVAVGHNAVGHTTVGHAAVELATVGHPHYPSSINEQLPPLRDGADTRVPYVSASKHTAVPSMAPAPASTPHATTLRFPGDTEGPTQGPTVTILTGTSSAAAGPAAQTQVYRITGGFSFTTPNSLDATRPSKAAAAPKPTRASKTPLKATTTHKNKVAPQNYFEIGRPTKVYPTPTLSDDAAADVIPTTPSRSNSGPSRLTPRPTLRPTHRPTARPTPTPRPDVAPTEYLSEYPAATVRGTTTGRTVGGPVTGTSVPLFTPHYGKDFEMSILKVMTSKVPSYIDIFTENGIRVTTARPEGGSTSITTKYSPADNYNTAVISTTRLFKENPNRGPYSLVANATEQKLSTTLQTRLAPGVGSVTTVLPSTEHTTADRTSTPSSPLQITFFVASEDETKQPSASTLVSDPYRQDDATTYQYTILRSVKQSIDAMRRENDSVHEEMRTSTEPVSSTRRIFTSKDEPTSNTYQETHDIQSADHSASTPESIVNGHTNHINANSKHVTQSYSQLLKNISLSTTTRKPWRPSTRRPWRQRSSYKDYYTQRRRLNHTTTEASVDPTSIVESRKTYSITASRKRKPSQGQWGKSYQKDQKHNKRRGQLEYPNTAEGLQPNADLDMRGIRNIPRQVRRFLQSSSES